MNGGAEFLVESPGTRLCTLRFFYTAVEEWEVKITDSVSVVTAKMPAIVKLRLVDNQPQEQITIGVEQAILLCFFKK